jgi:hypothetical protein
VPILYPVQGVAGYPRPGSKLYLAQVSRIS